MENRWFDIAVIGGSLGGVQAARAACGSVRLEIVQSTAGAAPAADLDALSRFGNVKFDD